MIPRNLKLDIRSEQAFAKSDIFSVCFDQGCVFFGPFILLVRDLGKCISKQQKRREHPVAMTWVYRRRKKSACSRNNLTSTASYESAHNTNHICPFLNKLRQKN